MLFYSIVILTTASWSVYAGVRIARSGALHKFMDSEELHFYFGTSDAISLPDYEIVDLPESLWSGRESITLEGGEFDESKHVSFKVFNKQVDLNLFPNKNLITPYTQIVKKSGNKTTKKFYAKNQQPNFCHYLHESVNSTAAISNCEATEIHGLIFLPDDSLEILPLNTRLKLLMSDGDDTRAVSQKIPHLVKRSSFDIQGTFENDFVVANFRRLPSRKKVMKRSRGISFDRPHVELGLFFDEAFYKIFAPFFEYDESKLDDFILSYINGVQSLYHHHSLGRKIDMTITYLEVMEVQQMPHAYGERNELLDNFCEYQKSINPSDDRDPEHFDMSVYVSGLDFFAWDANGFKNQVTMGLATVSGVCQEDYNCIIAEFGTNNQFGRPYPSAGFTSVYILAHEIGHNLGMSHDATGNSCSKEGYIMSPSRGTQGETTWSRCSASVAQKLNWAKCLFDKPSETSIDAWKHNGYPGVSYTAKDQCEILLRDRQAYPFYNGPQSSICENLHCRTPVKSGFFFAGPALAGTDCGNGKWCDHGACVSKSSYTTTAKPNRITTTTKKPTWTPWTSGNCKSECIKHSKGTRTNYRTCTKDGYCEGSSLEHDLCDDSALCPVRKSITEYGTQKCRDFSRKLNIVDGKGLGLQARYEPLRLWMPCAIFCKNKNSSSYFTPRVELNELGVDPYFPDGTWCHRDDNNVNYYCLQHHCLPENTKLSKATLLPSENDSLPFESFRLRFDATIDAENTKFVTFRP